MKNLSNEDRLIFALNLMDLYSEINALSANPKKRKDDGIEWIELKPIDKYKISRAERVKRFN